MEPAKFQRQRENYDVTSGSGTFRRHAEIERHRDAGLEITAQVFLMGAPLAANLPEAERAVLAQRLAALAHDLVAGDVGRPQ